MQTNNEYTGADALRELVTKLSAYQPNRKVAAIWRFIPGRCIEALSLEYPDWDYLTIAEAIKALKRYSQWTQS